MQSQMLQVYHLCPCGNQMAQSYAVEEVTVIFGGYAVQIGLETQLLTSETEDKQMQ